MFPWERRTRENFHRAEHHRQLNYDDRSLYAAANREEHQYRHLPSINHSFSHKYNSNISPQKFGDSYDTLEQQQQMIEQNQNTKSTIDTLRSRSYSPFIDRRSNNSHTTNQKKQYAMMLDDQIKLKEAQKKRERHRNIEIDRRILEDGAFYKYFANNQNENKYADESLKVNNSDIQYDYRKTQRTLPPRHNISRIKERYETPAINIADVRHEDSLRQNESLDYGFEQNKGDSSSSNIDQRSRVDDMNNRMKSYIKKLEYKKVLEQQIIEKNLKKQHEKEMKILEEKLEEAQNSVEKIKPSISTEMNSRAAQNGNANSTSSNEIKDMEILKPERPDSAQRRPSYTRKPPTLNIPPASGTIRKAKDPARIGTNDYNNTSMDSSPPKDNYASKLSRNIVGEEFRELENSNELIQIKNELKIFMLKMNNQLLEIKNEVLHLKSAETSTMVNKDHLYNQIIKEYPRLIATPFNIPSSHHNIPHITAPVLNVSDSKVSLNHETQFVPANEVFIERVVPKYTVITKPQFLVPPTIIHPTSTSEKPSSNEYGPLVASMVDLTKRLEQSIQDQQKKITHDLGNIQSELNSLKGSNSKERQVGFFLTDIPDEGESEKFAQLKTMKKHDSSQETFTANDDVSKREEASEKPKVRLRSKHIKFQKKGTKRRRKELPATRSGSKANVNLSQDL